MILFVLCRHQHSQAGNCPLKMRNSIENSHSTYFSIKTSLNGINPRFFGSRSSAMSPIFTPLVSATQVLKDLKCVVNSATSLAENIRKISDSILYLFTADTDLVSSPCSSA
jgi:hypothetical protein